MVFMAGNISTGRFWRQAKKIELRKSFTWPWESFAKVFADKGAIISRSAHLAKSTWGTPGVGELKSSVGRWTASAPR